MNGKYALIIGNTEYTDPGLAQLIAPGRDAEDLAHLLQDPQVGAFDDVRILLNQFSSTIIEAIDEFFNHKRPDDLLLMYFSGHGIRDEFGALYLAVRNTFRAKLRSTAVKSDYIREIMDQSRSRRQVLILDCCNSGAFTQGTKAATGVSIGTSSAFEGGYGRVILTASDSTQFAWEGDKVIGETDNSLFTHYLVAGLKGEADLDGDGRITVDELYDYTYEKVKLATPQQTPSKFSSKQQGEIVLRQNLPKEEIKSVPLPAPLLDSIENPFADIRLGAVRQLEKILNGRNLGLARSAREALERIVAEDDSRQVSRAAAQVLESVQETEIKVPDAKSEIITNEAQHIIHKRGVEAERLERARTEGFAAQVNKPEKKIPPLETAQATMPIINRQALITLGWAIAGAVGGIIYNFVDDDIAGGPAGAIGGAIGAGITAVALQLENQRFNWKRLLLFTLAWTIGLSTAWFIGELGTEPIPFVIGYAVGATISIAILLSVGYLIADIQSIARVVLAWTFGGSIGWTISRKLMIEIWSIDNATSWIIGTAIGWVIGGYVLGWQLLTIETSPEQLEDNRGIPESIEKHKVFLLSWKGRSLIGVIVGLILGILYGVLYGIIHGILYDFVYAYSTLYGDVPHIFLLVICGLAGLIAYPHRWTIWLMTGGFFVVVIAKGQGHAVYDLLAYGAAYGLPAGALISRILYWLRVFK